MTKFELDTEHALIYITPEVFPDADEFDFWASIFLHSDKVTLGEFEQGADRHMQRFRFADQPFELHFEHYGEQIWVAAVGVDATKKLTSLFQHFNAS